MNLKLYKDSIQRASRKRWIQCWSQSCLTTTQCQSWHEDFYLITLTTITFEPHVYIQMWLIQLINCRQRHAQLRKAWNKWQLEMVESLYLLETTLNLSFAIYYLVLLDLEVGIKKISVFKHIYRMSIKKCVDIYI
jgi:hypothetical protein